MSECMEVGRWAEIKTTKIYVNTALLELTESQYLLTQLIHDAAKAATVILNGTPGRNAWNN